jgi:pectin methylesterase-like acyl-CoA thioesterase
MRYLAILGSAAMLALIGSGSAGAAILCVSPDIASCFDTIQEAVDAASPGDTISIRGKRDRTAYNESVTVTTENLTIRGQGTSLIPTSACGSAATRTRRISSMRSRRSMPSSRRTR